MSSSLSPQLIHALSSAVYESDLAFRDLQKNYPQVSIVRLRDKAGESVDFSLRSAGVHANHLKLFTAKSGLFTVDRLSGFGFVAEGVAGRSGEIVLATRGTNFEHNKFDLATDANIGFGIGPRGNVVHRGFLKTFKTYQHQLIQLITDSGRRGNINTIHCMGHSLGGALANLNASVLRDAGYNVRLYTIGAPRVGILSFAEDTTRIIPPDHIHRVSNTGDPVPMVPIFPFVHASKDASEFQVTTTNSIALDNHMLNSGYVAMSRMTSWGDFVTPHPLNLDDPNALECRMAQIAGGSLFNTSLLGLITQGLIKLLKIIRIANFAVVQSVFSLGFTAVDLIAESLMRAQQMGVYMANEARTIISGMMKFLGRTLAAGQQLTYGFLAYVLNMFSQEMSSRALSAMQRAMKK